MKKKRIIWGLIALLVVLLAVGFIFFSPSSETGNRTAFYEPETSRIGSITTYYNFTGNLSARDTQNAAAYSAATVREVFVQEGEEVRKDAPLLRLSDGTVLKADIDGEVTAVHVKAGDAVSAGIVLVELVNFNSMEAIVKIDEYDVYSVNVGEKARITVDALGESFDGVITHISKIAHQAGDVSYYEATLSIDSDIEFLPGMKISAKVLRESVDNAVIISMDALKFDAYNKPYVLKKNGREYTAIPVSVGLNDGTSVQILSGISAGETIYIQRSMYDMMSVGSSGGTV